VWGSEFTTKIATPQGDLKEIARNLNLKLLDSVTSRWLVTGGVLPPIEPIPLFESI
jgi:hypothetical protein